MRHRHRSDLPYLICTLTNIINVAYREMKGTEITLSILKDLINFTVGVKDILFEKYEGSAVGGHSSLEKGPHPNVSICIDYMRPQF